MTDVFHQGGKAYKEFVQEIDNALELTEMLKDECEDKSARRKLKTLRCFFQMAHRLLKLHEQSQGTGNVIYSLIQSTEYKSIFGEFEAELTAQSHKMAS